ncbi:hypothetical protein NA57DRAFT_82295 [Rhizodiscina lignyota]|uniref:37S ribosomal protein mrp10, mitochondrial n=1 Tax=Rhizodiscina lignyota TaxID=1504668 RepID=A0A9P4M0M0_9PEZI|nr:hypothetical protein NA57DRAFT_82295 [Rhizodiscina lignyota]
MVPKPPRTAKSAALAAPKLPPLPKLLVRQPNPPEKNPCLNIMASVLSCWASTGYSVQGCGALEQQLRTCMDTKRERKTGQNDINKLLKRMYPRIIGPHKRK